MASMRIAMKNALRDKEEQERKESEEKEEKSSPAAVVKKKRTVTKPAAKSKSRAKRRKVETSSEEDEEDGKVSNSSSDDSSDDSDSDSSSSGSSDDEVNVEDICMKELGYGQNLYKNDEERQTFEAMPETEREKVLFERYEKRKALLETLKLRKTQKAQSKVKEKKTKKVRTKDPPKRQMSSRKARELKAQAAAHKDMKKRRNRVVKSDDESSDSSISSSSESDSESKDKMSVDEEEPSNKVRIRETQDSVKKEGLVTLVDINRMLIKRDMILKWMEEPFFNQIIGGFVRLSIGSADPNDAQVKVYRLCEIVGMNELSTPYQLEGKHVDQELVLQFAKDAKNWPVDRLSNQELTQAEFDYWAVRMREAKQALPTKDDADEFVQRVTDKIINYVYTEEDILRKIERKKSRRRRAVNLTAEIMDLKRRIKFHSDNGNHAEANKLKANLTRTERHLDEVKRKKEEAVRAMTEINRRNFIKNEAERERSREQRKIKKDVNQDNPYVSIPCRPKNLWATGARTAPAAKKDAAKPVEDTVVAGEEKEEKIQRVAARSGANDISLHRQISIDVNLTQPVPKKKSTIKVASAKQRVRPKEGSKKSGAAARKTMSLQEYIRRQTEAQQL